MGGVSQREAAAEGCHFSTRYYLQEFQCCLWKLWEWLRFRYVFTAELGKAVIGANEEVVTAYVVEVVIRGTVGRNGLGKLSPPQLDGVRQMLPGEDGPVVELGLVQLGSGAAKLRIWLALVVKLAVAVEEGYVAY